MSTHVRHLRGLTIATAVTVTAALVLVFFYAPLDAEQGFVQKIFYIHVPLAIVSLVGYCLGGVFGLMYLRTGKRVWDMRSYCAIHMSLIFSIGGLVAGSIWAKASWGHWWVWSGADAGLLPDRDPAVLHLPAAALLDRGSRAPGALRGRVRGRLRRVRADQLHRRPALGCSTCTRASSTSRVAPCRAR